MPSIHVLAAEDLLVFKALFDRDKDNFNRFGIGFQRRGIAAFISNQSGVATLLEQLRHVAQLDIHDLGQVLTPQRVEDHDLVEPVDELRPEMTPDDLHDSVFHLVILRLGGHGLLGLAHAPPRPR